MPTFKYTGKTEQRFDRIHRPDGSVLVVKPGETFQAFPALPSDADHADLEPVDQHAKSIVSRARDQAKAEASRVLVPVTEVPVIRQPGLLEFKYLGKKAKTYTFPSGQLAVLDAMPGSFFVPPYLTLAVALDTELEAMHPETIRRVQEIRDQVAAANERDAVALGGK